MWPVVRNGCRAGRKGAKQHGAGAAIPRDGDPGRETARPLPSDKRQDPYGEATSAESTRCDEGLFASARLPVQVVRDDLDRLDERSPRKTSRRPQMLHPAYVSCITLALEQPDFDR